MTNNDAFRQAHAIARTMRSRGDCASYREAFGLALRAVYAPVPVPVVVPAPKPAQKENKMTARPSSTTTTYKGREYRLLWVGDTKYGRRAKLGFVDGTGEFWVSADAIGGSARPAAACSKPKRRGGNGLGPRTGCACGSQMYGSKESDCRTCQFDQDDN